MTYEQQIEHNASQDAADRERYRKTIRGAENKVNIAANLAMVNVVTNLVVNLLMAIVLVLVVVTIIFPMAKTHYHDVQAAKAARVGDCSKVMSHGFKGSPDKYGSMLVGCIRNRQIEYDMVGRNRYPLT